jgi:hypothetical protein
MDVILMVSRSDATTRHLFAPVMTFNDYRDPVASPRRCARLFLQKSIGNKKKSRRLKT